MRQLQGRVIASERRDKRAPEIAQARRRGAGALVLAAALVAAFPAPAEADIINGVDVAYQTTWSNGHTYYVLRTPSTWAQAEAWAVQLGGHLATINDATEQSFAAGLRGASGLDDPHLWIGLHDPDADGEAGTDGNSSQWVWASGETSTYRNWGGFEPNQFLGLDEDEVHILNSQHYGGTGAWNDWLPYKSTFDYDSPSPKGIYGLVEVNMAPIPEPETYAMLLAGLGLLGWQARRRKMKRAA
jgi:hypothetical protein